MRCQGGDGENFVEVRANRNKLEVIQDGDLVASKSLRRLKEVNIIGSVEESVHLTLDFASGGLFSIKNGVNFLGLGGPTVDDTLTVVGTDDANVFSMTKEQIDVDGSAIFFDGVDEFTLDARLPDAVPGDSFSGFFAGGFSESLTPSTF